MTLYFPGVGIGCITDPGPAVLGEYFQHGYGLANGFALLGASLAMVVFAPLTQVLETAYGWRGTFMVLGGIYLNAMVMGTLLRPKPFKYESPDIEGLGYSTLAADESEKSGSLKNHDANVPECNGLSLSHLCFSVFESMNISMFKDPLFIVYLVVSITVRFVNVAWIIFLVPRALDTGVTPILATVVAIVAGVGDSSGRILGGLLNWMEIANATVILILGMAITSFSLIISVLIPTFSGMVILAFYQGLGIGMAYSILNVLYRESFGADRLVNVMGWTRGFGGIGRLLGVWVPGKF